MKDREYEIFLEWINNLTERRRAVTTIYLSVNTAIMGIIAFLLRDYPLSGWIRQASVLVLLVSGVVACDLWRRLIAQHSALIGWWYEQLRGLEEAIPECSRLLTREYQVLYFRRQGKTHIGLTRYETRLTWLFTVLYTAFGLAMLTSLFLSFVQ